MSLQNETECRTLPPIKRKELVGGCQLQTAYRVLIIIPNTSDTRLLFIHDELQIRYFFHKTGTF
jgi:hypothetical protein